jgi:LEA14-like dessication related protein
VRWPIVALAVVLAACSRPAPPTIVPEKAVVTAISPAGIQMNVELALDNPNGVALSARTVTANVVLDGKYPLSSVTVPHEVTLAAHSRSALLVPMTLKWEGVSTLVALAGSQRNVPYEVNGSVNLGGDLLNVDVPFHLAGVLTKEQLVQLTLNSLPRFLP